MRAPRSTVYELVNRLTDAGMLETFDAEGRVYFGRTLYFYGNAHLDFNDLSRRARTEVQRLAEAVGETAQFCALSGNKYVVVHSCSSSRLFRISGEIGVPVPLPWTASGRLLLDHLDDAALRRFVPPEDYELPDGRTIDPGQFFQEIRQARSDGFCVIRGLLDDFSSCMAAPVRDDAGIAAGCMCLVAPVSRAGEEPLLAALIESVNRLAHGPADAAP